MTATPLHARRAAPGRPRKLTQERIIEAAFTVMEKEGYAALTLRSLAQELGISHSNLYNYVGHIEDVEAEVLKQLLARLPRPRSTDAAGVRSEYLEYLKAARAVMVKHPHVVAPPIGSPAWLSFSALTEEWLRALAHHESDTRALGAAYSALISYVAVHAERERLQGPDYLAKSMKAMKNTYPASRSLAALEQRVRKDSAETLADILDVLVSRLLPGLSAPSRHKRS